MLNNCDRARWYLQPGRMLGLVTLLCYHVQVIRGEMLVGTGEGDTGSLLPKMSTAANLRGASNGSFDMAKKSRI